MPSEPGASGTTEPTDAELVAALTKVLVRACRELADAGQPRRAGVLAAEGWKLVRASDTRAAAHLDGAMHYIARKDTGPVPVASDPKP